MEDNHSPVMKPHKILQKASSRNAFLEKCQNQTPAPEGAGKPQSFFILSFYASVSLKLDLTNEHTASLWELVFLGGAKWSRAHQSAGYLRAAEHREAGTSAAGGIKSVPSDTQGFMGLVKIAFPTVQIKHRRMFSTQAVE